MGRRKIEIQPITQERNRSVTFAKRKNGLFKKAYELGVLCSVDVAVIIFETRPGQDPKLHQYCSTDIRRIIQRHGQHHGEKDLKGPSDFSGPAGAATADDGDDDEGGNDEEDEEDRPGRGSKKANRSGLILADQEGSNTNEGGYLSQGPPLGYAGASIYGGHIPPPPPMHGSGPIDPDLAGMGSMLPVSNDRVSSMRESDTRASKRQKRTLDSMDPGSRSPALRAGGRDLLNFAAGPHDPNQQDRFYPEMRPPYLEHGANPGPYPYHNAQNTHHQGFNPNPNYAPMFSAFAPPQPFLPLQSSFGPPPHGPAPGSRDVGQGHPAGGFGGPDASREGRFSGPQFDPALFNPQGGMIPGRHSPQDVNVSQRSQRGSGSQGGERSPIEPAIRERGRPDSQMADRVPSSGGGDASASIEWPSYRHGNTQGATSQSPRVEGSFRPLSALGQNSMPSQDSSVRGNTNDGWLDALSNANPGPVHAAASRPGTSSDTSTRSKGRASRAGTDVGKLGGESDVGGAGGGVARDGNGAKVETKD